MGKAQKNVGYIFVTHTFWIEKMEVIGLVARCYSLFSPIH